MLGLTACEPATSGHMKDWLGVDIVKVLRNTDLIGKICVSITVMFSIVSWAIIIYKFVQLHTASSQTKRFMKECMSGSGDLEEAYRKASKYPDSPLAQILREGYLELEIEDWYKQGYDLTNRSARRDGEAGH